MAKGILGVFFFFLILGASYCALPLVMPTKHGTRRPKRNMTWANCLSSVHTPFSRTLVIFSLGFVFKLMLFRFCLLILVFEWLGSRWSQLCLLIYGYLGHEATQIYLPLYFFSPKNPTHRLIPLDTIKIYTKLSLIFNHIIHVGCLYVELYFIHVIWSLLNVCMKESWHIIIVIVS